MGFRFLYLGNGLSSSVFIAIVGFFLCLSFYANAQAQPLEYTLHQDDDHSSSDGQQIPLNHPPEAIPLSGSDPSNPQKPIQDGRAPTDTLKKLLDALGVMQSAYFETWQGTWPTSIDWTAAVLATHISATLSSLSMNLDAVLGDGQSATAGGCTTLRSEPFDALAYENLINYYFLQLSTFYFGENAFSIRMQAYDDMLWVILEWLENIKFQNLHSSLHYSSYSKVNDSLRPSWHGTQFSKPAAHRARLFYDLASQGWDTSLCSGGMVWSPYLEPYKNAITNELFISASIAMYLYFPGDDIDSPLLSEDDVISEPHNPAHLNSAITAYEWLKNSNMTVDNGLYGDGFHIRGWKGPTNPGTKKCDVLDRMVYTYNQGVVLSGLRGLWLATGTRDYLEDGHQLVENVIKATGWPNTSSQKWQGLGRGGVLEEACDSSGSCSQNGHTFKGIFFHHFAEFCRPLSSQEEQYLSSTTSSGEKVHRTKARRSDYNWHQDRCSTYHSWVSHNANASYATKDDDGKFGMWWGRPYPYNDPSPIQKSPLPKGAIDYRNKDPFADHHDDESYQHLPNGTLDKIDFPGHRRSRLRRKDNKETRPANSDKADAAISQDVNDRGRGRTVETQSGAVAVLRALFQWETTRSSADSGKYFL
ncbi:hypothetical protein AJ79_09892 [Helicocarpus griseus UAMH5409]|uniref:Glycosyl hydrolase n=1 Tax=Helicocarpus griseus UAMH5409 TaxID=1447875 RepID=A0A2B7WGR8_9EURO|nr:hypothetical protein AJ79_09892 [Helicocarpus griseus UAMH5409]